MFAFALSCLVEWPTMKAAKLLLPTPQRKIKDNNGKTTTYSAKELEQTESTYDTKSLTTINTEKNSYDNHSYYNEKELTSL